MNYEQAQRILNRQREGIECYSVYTITHALFITGDISEPTLPLDLDGENERGKRIRMVSSNRIGQNGFVSGYQSGFNQSNKK